MLLQLAIRIDHPTYVLKCAHPVVYPDRLVLPPAPKHLAVMRTSSAPVRQLVAVVGSLSQLIAAAPSPGCANATDGSKVKTDSMSNIKLGNREYLLYVPTKYEATVPAPLILSYHGGSRDADFQAALDLFNSTFFNKDYLVAYPNSVNVST